MIVLRDCYKKSINNNQELRNYLWKTERENEMRISLGNLLEVNVIMSQLLNNEGKMVEKIT